MSQWEVGTRVELNCELVVAEKSMNEMVKCQVVIAGNPQLIELPTRILRAKRNKRSGAYIRFQ